MSELVAESGAQLLARISSELRPTLENLCVDIFPDHGPFAGDLVEITGESGNGKSQLIMELMARTILPLSYGGREARVLFFNLDNKFKIHRFVYVLEKVACAANTSTKEDAMKEIIENSLHNLLVFSCFTPEEHELAQFQVDDLLTSDLKISLITIDSTPAFYWLECEQNKMKMETYLTKAIQSYQKLCREYKVVVAYTRDSNFASKYIQLPTTDAASPDYRIRLLCHESEGVRGFEAEIEAKGASHTTIYSIDNFGVKFLKL